jgi:hypothetical protein
MKVLKGWRINFIVVVVLIFSGCEEVKNTGEASSGIQPYQENPRYWQYQGEPVLLIGATSNDNLYQNKNLESHLDSLHAAGGNYVRNTMSDRDPGDEKAFLQLENGKYDLNQWNPRYWEKFENLLKLASERDIIVQIEIWDRFDHSRDNWLTDPYNPGNNINYGFADSKLDSIYPKHPGANEQPFFFTVPELDNNQVVLPYQQAFVNKLLDISLPFSNVLYCIDNETRGREEWATFWAQYLREKAGETEIMVTQMWDEWDVKADMHKRTIDHPELYDYIDLSQNSQTIGHPNWENAQFVLDYIDAAPRPVNSTKIYGSNEEGGWKDQGKDADHAVDSFFRNLLGGFASSRFHRPYHGLGLSKISINCLKSIREVEKKVRFWNVNPSMELLIENEAGEAYLAADPGTAYIVYFPGQGTVKLNLEQATGNFDLQWIEVREARWMEPVPATGGQPLELTAPFAKGSLALITVR